MPNTLTTASMTDAVVIYLPQVYTPDDRCRLLEAPLAQLLPGPFARIDGGGTWFHGASDVWVYTSSLTIVLPIIRSFLLQAGFPVGTQVQYRRGKLDLHDQLYGGGWKIGCRSLGYALGLSIGV